MAWEFSNVYDYSHHVFHKEQMIENIDAMLEFFITRAACLD